MKTLLQQVVSCLYLGVMLLAVSPAAPAQQNHHGHESAEPPALRLNDGQRWATDAPLRAGMSRIRQAFEQALPAFRAGTAGHGAYAALAEELDSQLRFLFANCRLPPDADAQLHVLLAQVADAASALGEAGEAAPGMHALHRALKMYGDYFRHPGWSDEFGSDAG